MTDEFQDLLVMIKTDHDFDRYTRTLSNIVRFPTTTGKRERRGRFVEYESGPLLFITDEINTLVDDKFVKFAQFAFGIHFVISAPWQTEDLRREYKSMVEAFAQYCAVKLSFALECETLIVYNVQRPGARYRNGRRIDSDADDG